MCPSRSLPRRSGGAGEETSSSATQRSSIQRVAWGASRGTMCPAPVSTTWVKPPPCLQYPTTARPAPACLPAACCSSCCAACTRRRLVCPTPCPGRRRCAPLRLPAASAALGPRPRSLARTTRRGAAAKRCPWLQSRRETQASEEAGPSCASCMPAWGDWGETAERGTGWGRECKGSLCCAGLNHPSAPPHHSR